jgi:hypothetical protein
MIQSSNDKTADETRNHGWIKMDRKSPEKLFIVEQSEKL